MKNVIFKLIFFWNMFPWAQLTIKQICSDNGLAPNRRQLSHNLNQWWPSLLMHICVTRPHWVDIANWKSIKIDTVLLGPTFYGIEIRGQSCLARLLSFSFYRLHDAVCCCLPALLRHGSCNSPWYCGAERWTKISIGAHKNDEWYTERGGWDALRLGIYIIIQTPFDNIMIFLVCRR